MADETVRVRLRFEDRRILSKSQKKEGLSRSWVFLNLHHHRTVSDVSAHLLDAFNLFDACPHGLSLSMDGFVLPPFESSCILKDNDIVCVKKKKGRSLETIRVDDSGNVSDRVEFEDRQYVRPGLKLLANEEFQKETGGYESESEEDERDEVEDGLREKKVTGKRKAASKSPSSERKKCKLAAGEGGPKEDEHGASEGKNKKSCSGAVDTKKSLDKKRKLSDAVRAQHKSQMTEVDEENNDIAKSNIDSNRSLQQAEAEEAEDLCQNSGETKKTPSRSARRKKAKRQWLRENAKLENQELQQKQLTATHRQKSLRIVNHRAAEEHEDPNDPSDDAGDEVVPVEVRPGHFRFEPLGKVVVEKTVQESQTPKVRTEPVWAFNNAVWCKENFAWNGILSKKKGQKWGVEKKASAKRYDQNFSQDLSQTQTTEAETPATGQIDHEKLCNGILSKKGQKWGMEEMAPTKRYNQNFSQDFSRTQTAEEEIPATVQIDYEKLMPYTGSPKEGDVVAYRLIELSSSWTPEISSFRVGKITHYDAGSKKVTLATIPDFPVEKKTEDDDSPIQPDATLYKEDGSLEIEFSSLLDVRSFDLGDSNAERPVAATAEVDGIVHESDQTAKTESQPLIGVNGTMNAWEEISQAISAKKTELSKENDWKKKENSSRGSWSYKALRSSALGPVMNYLRSQKEL